MFFFCLFWPCLRPPCSNHHNISLLKSWKKISMLALFTQSHCKRVCCYFFYFFVKHTDIFWRTFTHLFSSQCQCLSSSRNLHRHILIMMSQLTHHFCSPYNFCSPFKRSHIKWITNLCLFATQSYYMNTDDLIHTHTAASEKSMKYKYILYLDLCIFIH